MIKIAEIENGTIDINLEEVGVNDVMELIDKMSVKSDLPDDAVTLLYSGTVTEYKLGTIDIVLSLENVRCVRV